MSTLQQPAATPRKKPGVEYVEYDKYIDRQVERTRRAVKLIDLTQALLVLVIGLVGFLLTAAVVEHWIFAGGLGTFGRFAMFALMIGSLGYYAVRFVWPLVTSTINPAYAAAAIEREHPALKNSLLNFLLFRSHKKEMPAAVYEALEQQAAQRLSQTSIEDSIDRSALVKLGYVLLAVVVFATLYAMLSPKSSLATAARVLMPWASIAAPSRVRIEDIQPGNVEVVEGEQVEITAKVFGLSEGELVEVSYDTVDGHRVDQRVAMQPANNAGKFVVTLPPPGDVSGLSGIDQDLRYRITAGDGRTIDYDIRVLTAPSIRVEQVHFDFPDYTGYAGYADVTIDGRGDIRAIEGTKVTIHAKANTDIESAFLDLASDGLNDTRMKHEGSKAQVGLDLRLDDRRAIKTTSYMLRYTSIEGLANSQPPQHSLDIVPDYAPEVDLVAPEDRMRDVQMNETVVVSIDAIDPDFALRTVAIKVAKEDGTAVHDELLLDRPHDVRYTADWNFTPQDLKLQPGDVVEYWAEATDIRTPQANRTASDRKQFRVVGDPNQASGRREASGNSEGEQGAEGAEGQQGAEGAQGDKGDKGDKGEAGAKGQEGAQGQGSEQVQGSEQGQGAEQNAGGEQGQGVGQGENSESGEGEGNQQGAGAGTEQQQGAEGMDKGQQQGAGGAGGEQQSEGESQDSEGGEQGQGGASGSREVAGNQREASGSEGSEQGEPQEGDNQPSGEGQNSRPVANDGSDDTTAFEKIQRQLSQEEKQNATRQQKEGSADPNGETEQGEQQNAEQGEQGQPGELQGKNDPQASGRREASGKNTGDQPSQGTPQGQGENASNENKSNNEAGEQPREGEQQPPNGQEGSAAEREAQNKGADTNTDAPQSEGGQPDGAKPDAASQSAGSEERNAGGDPGAGQDTQAQGTPEAQEEMRQREKKPDSSEGGEKQGGEPPTPAHGKHQSDSASSQDGDRAGGGDEGGGQKAPRDGTGSVGQNQAADEGAGQSDDQGPGETGTRGGDSEKAEGETGQSGDEQGNGSESRERQGEGQKQGDPQASGRRQASGDQAEASANQRESSGEKTGDDKSQGTPDHRGEQASKGEQGAQGQPDKRQQQNQPPQNKPPTEQGSNNASSQAGQPGGNDGTASSPPPGAFDGTVAEGDKANLEYTRQQTNMVLEKLADQLDKNQVDQKMLDELGWSEDDLRRFVDRWNKLRAAAEKPNATDAQQELDARLRSLGGSLGIKSGTTDRTQDDFRDLNEGYQNKVPLKYRDRLKAYTEGVSRGAGEKE